MKRALGSLVALVLAAVAVWVVTLYAASCSTTTVGAFVCRQSGSAGIASSAAPTFAFGTNLTASNVVVGEFCWGSGTATLNSITSSSGCTGATWTIADTLVLGGAHSGASFYGTGAAAGACTVQFNLSAAAVSEVEVHELGGANLAAPVGTRHAITGQTGPGTGTDAVTVGPVTASGTDYIFGGSCDLSQGATINAGTGYTIRESIANAQGSISSEDKSNSGANTVTFTDTNAGSANISVILSVAASGGGGSTGTGSKQRKLKLLEGLERGHLQ